VFAKGLDPTLRARASRGETPLRIFNKGQGRFCRAFGFRPHEKKVAANEGLLVVVGCL